MAFLNALVRAIKPSPLYSYQHPVQVGRQRYDLQEDQRKRSITLRDLVARYADMPIQVNLDEKQDDLQRHPGVEQCNLDHSAPHSQFGNRVGLTLAIACPVVLSGIRTAARQRPAEVINVAVEIQKFLTRRPDREPCHAPRMVSANRNR